MPPIKLNKSEIIFVIIISIIVIISIIIVILRIEYLRSLSNKNSEIIVSAQTSEIQNTISSSSTISSNTPISSTETATSSRDIYKEYLDYSKALKEIVKNQNTAKAFEKLIKDTKSVKIVQENCHSFTHDIGHATFEKLNNDFQKALKEYNEYCGGGYLHGIVEEYIEVNENNKVDFLHLCKGNDGRCIHAVGHGVMLLNKLHVKPAIEECKKFTTSQQQTWCAEGVFMEQFDLENIRDKEKPDFKVNDPYYPCYEMKGVYKNACYYYLGRYFWRNKKYDMTEVYKACLKADSEIEACIRGAGAASVRSYLYESDKMEEVCGLTKNYFRTCISGAVYYSMIVIGKVETSKIMCNNFKVEKNKKTCNEILLNY